VVYAPESGNPSAMDGAPLAVVIGSAATGRVRLERWRLDQMNWDTK